MQLADHFNVLLKDTVNLSQFKLDLLNQRVEAIYKALKADVEIGALITGKTPQGSWAHRTIINPVGDNEFDADFMLDMSQNPDWADNPKTYIDEVYAALHRHSTYGTMPHSRKCRCAARLRQLHARRHRPSPQPGRRSRGHRQPRRQRVGADEPAGFHRLDEETGLYRQRELTQSDQTHEIPS